MWYVGKMCVYARHFANQMKDKHVQKAKQAKR